MKILNYKQFEAISDIDPYGEEDWNDDGLRRGGDWHDVDGLRCGEKYTIEMLEDYSAYVQIMVYDDIKNEWVEECSQEIELNEGEELLVKLLALADHFVPFSLIGDNGENKKSIALTNLPRNIFKVKY